MFLLLLAIIVCLSLTYTQATVILDSSCASRQDDVNGDIRAAADLGRSKMLWRYLVVIELTFPSEAASALQNDDVFGVLLYNSLLPNDNLIPGKTLCEIFPLCLLDMCAMPCCRDIWKMHCVPRNLVALTNYSLPVYYNTIKDLATTGPSITIFCSEDHLFLNKDDPNGPWYDPKFIYHNKYGELKPINVNIGWARVKPCRDEKKTMAYSVQGEYPLRATYAIFNELSGSGSGVDSLNGQVHTVLCPLYFQTKTWLDQRPLDTIVSAGLRSGFTHLDLIQPREVTLFHEVSVQSVDRRLRRRFTFILRVH